MKTLVRAAFAWMLIVSLPACQKTKVVNDFGGSPTGPSSTTTITLVSERFAAPCQKTLELSMPQVAKWRIAPESSATITTDTALATAVMRASGNYTITATTQDGRVASFSFSLDCGGGVPPGPTSGFGITTPISCEPTNLGEYNVFLGWNGYPGSTGYRAEFKTSKDSNWKDVAREFRELATIANNAMVLKRLRTDIDHSFRVFALVNGGPDVLWSTPESQASCYKLSVCSNHGDDDRDGKIDRDDPGCSYPQGYYDPNDSDETDPPTIAGPGPGPGPGPGGGTPNPPSGACVLTQSLTPSGGSRPRNSTGSVHAAWSGASCPGHYYSTHPEFVQVHPTSGALLYVAPGNATICAQPSVSNANGSTCGSFTTTP